MKINEVKRMVEEVVSTQYIADDGTLFYSKEECEKYEQSALFVVNSKLKRLNGRDVSVFDLYDEGSEEDGIEIFDVQTEEDLENLRRYVYLTLAQNNATPKEGEVILADATIGHEIIVFWWYDRDGYYILGDGSLDSVIERIKKNYLKCFKTREQLRQEREARNNAN